jgi:hypothetical protein
MFTLEIDIINWLSLSMALENLLEFLRQRITCKRTDANCNLHLGVFHGIESTGKQ